MIRALEIEEPVPPAGPRNPGPEPIPRFSLEFHDATGTCSKGHLFSETVMRLRMARFFGGPDIGSDLPYDRQLDHLCPHCIRAKWREEERAHAIFEAEREKEERRIARIHEHGWTRHRPRRLDVG